MTGLVGDAAQPPESSEVARDVEVGALYAKHGDRLQRYLVAHGCTKADADDIVHDTILIVRRRWDNVRDLEKPAAYWYKIATRKMWRVRKNHAKFLLDPESRLQSRPRTYVDGTYRQAASAGTSSREKVSMVPSIITTSRVGPTASRTRPLARRLRPVGLASGVARVSAVPSHTNARGTR